VFPAHQRAFLLTAYPEDSARRGGRTASPPHGAGCRSRGPPGPLGIARRPAEPPSAATAPTWARADALRPPRRRSTATLDDPVLADGGAARRLPPARAAGGGAGLRGRPRSTSATTAAEPLTSAARCHDSEPRRAVATVLTRDGGRLLRGHAADRRRHLRRRGKNGFLFATNPLGGRGPTPWCANEGEGGQPRLGTASGAAPTRRGEGTAGRRRSSSPSAPLRFPRRPGAGLALQPSER